MASGVSDWFRGLYRGVCADDVPVDLSCDVPFQAADDLAFGLALRETSPQVVLGRARPAQAAEDDPVEGGVGLVVAAAVESAALSLAGGCLDRAGATQGGEGCLAVEAFRVVTAEMSRAAAVCGPTPWTSSRPGVLAWIASAIGLLRSLISSVRCWMRRASSLKVCRAAPAGPETSDSASRATCRTRTPTLPEPGRPGGVGRGARSSGYR